MTLESLSRLADSFLSLTKNVLTAREQQLAAFTVAWPLLIALNQMNATEGGLLDENQLLRDCIEELERQIAILSGRMPKPVIPLWVVRNLSLEVAGDPVEDNPHNLVSEDEGTKRSDLEIPLELDPSEI